MKKNVGTIDRLIRVFAALVLGVMVFVGNLNGLLSVIIGIIAIILLFTGIVGWCGLYTICGISTKK
ncbi:MAG: DUF2892 domain-containing protein [Elusimicrobia bacterium]|nr:DUF2892 domain-containing protein [Elusimicrobiota bacterium]